MFDLTQLRLKFRDVLQNIIEIRRIAEYHVCHRTVVFSQSGTYGVRWDEFQNAFTCKIVSVRCTGEEARFEFSNLLYQVKVRR